MMRKDQIRPNILHNTLHHLKCGSETFLSVMGSSHVLLVHGVTCSKSIRDKATEGKWDCQEDWLRDQCLD